MDTTKRWLPWPIDTSLIVVATDKDTLARWRHTGMLRGRERGGFPPNGWVGLNAHYSCLKGNTTLSSSWAV